jgi:phage terminase small subunit
MAITPKRQRFVEEYLVDLNATRAAIRAGYSPRTANREGARLLSNAVIAEAISERQKRREERTEVTQDMVVAGLLVEAKLTGEGSSHSARVAAWTQLGKHLGMFKDRVEHSGATTVTHIYMPPNGRDDDPASPG